MKDWNKLMEVSAIRKTLEENVLEDGYTALIMYTHKLLYIDVGNDRHRGQYRQRRDMETSNYEQSVSVALSVVIQLSFFEGRSQRSLRHFFKAP